MTGSSSPNLKSSISSLKSRILDLNGGHWSWAVLLLCAIAIGPLLRSESPCTHDGALHYFRVVAMRHALKDGVLFTRYLPDLAFGYGYPFFNYRAALSYYLALVLYLTGLPLPVALNLVYVLSIVGSALGAYLLGRDLFGPWGGVVSAVAYAYAPYQFLDALLRANMPESVALALLPFILWVFRRLILTGQRRWFLASVVSLSALHLTHNISFLLFTPFLLAYLAVLWFVYRREGRWAACLGALGLAWGMTAFFWGPALLEGDYVQLHMSHVTRNNDFHYNFLPLSEIFAPPAAVDTSLMNPPMRVHLGLVQAILGGIGLAVGLTGSAGLRRAHQRDRERRATLGFLALTTAGMIWISTSSSLWLWEHVPLLPFVQFPWRLVGRAALPVALLAGATTLAFPSPAQHAARSRFHISRLTFFAIIALLILAAFPSTYPPRGYCPSAPHPGIGDVFAYERRSKLVGVDPEGSYFPVWVKQRPDGSPLEEQYAAGGTVARFDETALPPGASITGAEYSPNWGRIIVETPTRFRARYRAFYFPGWQAWVDGEAVEVSATDPQGLISFDIPAGRHTVVVRFGSTSVRTTFTILSFISLVILVALLEGNREGLGNREGCPYHSGGAAGNREGLGKREGLGNRKGCPYHPGVAAGNREGLGNRKGCPYHPGVAADNREGLGNREGCPYHPGVAAGNREGLGNRKGCPYHPGVAAGNREGLGNRKGCPYVLSILAICLFVLKLVVVDRTHTVFRHPTLRSDGTLATIAHPLYQDYADGLTLMGYDQGQAAIPADGTLRLDLYWTAHARPTARYQSVVHLVGTDGMRWSLPDTFRPRGYADYPPTTAWEPGQYALDSQEVEPLPGTPPGTYDVVLTVFDRDTLSPLSALNEQGQPAAPTFTLGQVMLTAPRHPPTLDALGIHHRVDTALGPLTLLGADFDRHQAAPGDPLLLTTFWRADPAPTQPAPSTIEVNLTAHLTLLASDGSPAAEYLLPPSAPGHPTSAWHPGDIWRGQHLLHLPAHLQDGHHAWRLAVEPGGQATRLPTTLHVTTPTRTFTPPAVEVEIDARLDDVATLVGADVQPETPDLKAGTPVTVTLVWRAEGETSTSYHVFLHLLDPQGRLVAQSDTVPAGWSRPTTGWLAGEYVTDVHVLTLPSDAPAGDYTLSAGLYVPGGERLATASGADTVHLTTIEVRAP